MRTVWNEATAAAGDGKLPMSFSLPLLSSSWCCTAFDIVGGVVVVAFVIIHSFSHSQRRIHVSTKCSGVDISGTVYVWMLHFSLFSLIRLDRYVCTLFVRSVSALMLPMDFSTLFELCALTIARYIDIFTHAQTEAKQV